jgi:hypothetical protein
MPMLKRPDGEIYYEEFGSGFPILLFAPGGLLSRLEMWRHPADGPQRLRVAAFLDRHTPAA